MLKCEQCGGRVRRVHRTFFERFSYMAIYECRDCDTERCYPRRYTYHFGPHCRCPHCGTFRVTRLKSPDKIDRWHTGFLNYLERLAAGYSSTTAGCWRPRTPMGRRRNTTNTRLP